MLYISNGPPKDAAGCFNTHTRAQAFADQTRNMDFAKSEAGWRRRGEFMLRV